MTMFGNLIFLLFLSVLILINGQYKDDRDLPPMSQLAGRTSKVLFDTSFPQGRCPRGFNQVGDECVYLSSAGKIYSWRQAGRACSQQIARILKDQSSSTIDQPNMEPTKGVRQLILNTPEKTEIFRVLYREYGDQNFAVRLPNDYNTLQRCQDGQDDKWPQYCTTPRSTNSTCFETISNGPNDICLREVECASTYLRLACEFTLPGSTELINSKFRNCPNVRGRRGLPKWAWIAIIIGSALLLLLIVGAIFAFVRKSRNSGGSKKKFLPEPRIEEKVIRVPKKREDPAAEPMLIRAAPKNISDTGYLQPESLSRDNTANA